MHTEHMNLCGHKFIIYHTKDNNYVLIPCLTLLWRCSCAHV